MTLRTVMVRESPCGLFLTSAQKDHITSEYEVPFFSSNAGQEHFLPLIKTLNLDLNADIRFVSSENIRQNDLQTYHPYQDNGMLSSRLKRETRIDVSNNDLFYDGVRIVLNFTNYDVTITSPLGLPKKFSRLISDRFDQFKGQLLFLTVHSLNSLTMFPGETSNDNYLTRMMNKLPTVSSLDTVELREICTYVTGVFQSNKNFERKNTSGTIKVITSACISEDKLFADNKDPAAGVYIANKQVLISLTSPENASVHPRYLGINLPQEALLGALRDIGVSCYVVDNNDRISDRYINLAGKVVKVPKVKDVNGVEGLHIVSLDKGVPLNVENVIPLDKVDSNPYIYKSHEEALTGADMRAKYQEELEKERGEAERVRMATKAEYEELSRNIELKHKRDLHELQKKREEEQAELEKMRREREEDVRHQEALFKQRERELNAEYENRNRSLQKELEDLKNEGARKKWMYDEYSMATKAQYEGKKYERDNSLEVLKTVAAVAGVVATGIMLYSKMSK